MAIHPFQIGSFAPLLSACSDVSYVPSMFKEMEYTPSLLLPVALPVSMIGDEQYQEGAMYGDFDYFEAMYQVGFSGLRDMFVDRWYTWQEVEQEVMRSVVTQVREYGSSFLWCVGFAHGWLSALALTDRALALQGLDLLVSLVHAEQQKAAAFSQMSSRSVGLDGFPLDM